MGKIARCQKGRAQLGFTLIEILVSLTIIAVISGASFAAFQGFQQNQVLSATTQDVLTELRTARTRSIAGVIPDTCSVSSKSLKNYTFIRINATQYRVDILCSGATTVQGIQKTLPQTLLFDTINSSSTVQFTPSSGFGIFSPAFGGVGKIVICRLVCGGSSQKSITIQPSGIISIP